jgi:pimeloyl-ACP methyl ester carboxylesterase
MQLRQALLKTELETMNTTNLLIAFLLFIALLLTGCSAQESPILELPEGAQAGDLTELNDCQFQPKGNKAQYAAECGTLTVPENWDKADSRLITLPVVRIPSSGQDPAEPVFFLQGGPGSPNLSWEPPDWILENHDVVMIGYRGAEGTVVLSCPDANHLFESYMGKDLLSEQVRNDGVAALQRCADTYAEAHVDLSGYTVPGVVEDFEAARIALGYDRIDLFSLSYGTRVAQVYAYMHPDSLYRLVLIGVNTPGHFIWDRAVYDKMIEHISELCAQDAACSSRTGDFAQTMYEVNRSMPERWLFFRIDPGTVRQATNMLFFGKQNMPMAFDAYLAAAEGDPSGLAMLNLMSSLVPFDPVLGDQYSKAGTLDLDKYRGIESVNLGNSIMGTPLSEAVWPMAAGWPIQLISNDLREFQESDVEMLLVNGSVDFSTPPTALEETRPYFHNAQMILLPEFSHVGDVTHLQPEAFERLITSYYNTGVADDSLYVYEPLSFEPKMSLTAIARLLVAAMVLVPALIILGAVLAVRRRLRGRRRMIAGQTAVDKTLIFFKSKE